MKVNAIDEFKEIWSKFDPHATGFIDIDSLEPFLIELCRSEEGKELVVLSHRVEKISSIRKRFLNHLSIPTYGQMKKVMFYDVLQ